jgi:hypothetical protein
MRNNGRGPNIMTMNGRKLLGASVVVIAMMLGTASVEADTGDCSNELDDVATAISNADFDNARDQTRLLNKVTQTRAKVDLDKCSDALDKLDDIDTKVLALSTPGGKGGKTKLDDPADATAIFGATNAAATCIATITTCAD